MNVGDALREATRQLKDAGVDAPRADARILMQHVSGTKSGELLSENMAFDGPRATEFAALIERRLAREPIAYILGRKQFWNLEIEVGPGALVPRPESELLIEELEKLFHDRNGAFQFVDCGTGTGCLLVAALTLFPNARGRGIDSSGEALRWARANSARHGLGRRFETHESDWSQGIGVDADAILANPPYIKRADIAALAPEVVRYEPTAALDGGPDGLNAYRSLAPLTERALKPGGVALFEIGAGQAKEVPRILSNAGLETVRVAPDLAGIPRCVVAQKAR